jgi:hypothetical protein
MVTNNPKRFVTARNRRGLFLDEFGGTDEIRFPGETDEVAIVTEQDINTFLAAFRREPSVMCWSCRYQTGLEAIRKVAARRAAEEPSFSSDAFDRAVEMLEAGYQTPAIADTPLPSNFGHRWARLAMTRKIPPDIEIYDTWKESGGRIQEQVAVTGWDLGRFDVEHRPELPLLSISGRLAPDPQHRVVLRGDAPGLFVFVAVNGRVSVAYRHDWDAGGFDDSASQHLSTVEPSAGMICVQRRRPFGRTFSCQRVWDIAAQDVEPRALFGRAAAYLVLRQERH